MIAQAGSPLAMNYTAFDEDTALNILANVWDVTVPASPILRQSSAMTHISAGSYISIYSSPTKGKQYLVQMLVYTDNSFSVLDPNYSPGSYTVEAVDFASLIWDALVSAHGLSGSFGQAIAALQSDISGPPGILLPRGVVVNPSVVKGVVVDE